jgi:hypothetical protein
LRSIKKTKDQRQEKRNLLPKIILCCCLPSSFSSGCFFHCFISSCPFFISVIQVSLRRKERKKKKESIFKWSSEPPGLIGKDKVVEENSQMAPIDVKKEQGEERGRR